MYDPKFRSAFDEIPSRHDTYKVARKEDGNRNRYCSVWDDEGIVFEDECDGNRNKARPKTPFSESQSAMLNEAQKMAADAVERLRTEGRLEGPTDTLVNDSEPEINGIFDLDKHTHDDFTRMHIDEDESDADVSFSKKEDLFNPPSRSTKLSENELDELD